jgi:TolB-like protein
MLRRVLLTLVVLLAATPAADSPKLVVLELQHLGGATEAEARSLNDAVVAVTSSAGVFQVVSQRDIITLLGVERQKQLLGCGEESTSCLAELSGALDARFLVSGSLNKVGKTYQLTLQTLDARKSQPIGRSLRASQSLDELRKLLPWAVSEATGTSSPKAPSRVVPTLLMVAGGLGLVAGGFVVFQAETREQAIVRELATTKLTQALPRRAVDYQADAKDLANQKTSALLLFSLGAIAAAAGAWWYFSIPDVSGGRLALVPTGSGAALVGAF